jgi:hypothetical protein
MQHPKTKRKDRRCKLNTRHQVNGLIYLNLFTKNFCRHSQGPVQKRINSRLGSSNPFRIHTEQVQEIPRPLTPFLLVNGLIYLILFVYNYY